MRIVTHRCALVAVPRARLVRQEAGADRYGASAGRSRKRFAHREPPIEWAENRNVRWKVEIPGRGSASPVIWGDRVFVLTAIPAGASVPESHAPRGGVNPRSVHRYVVMALDRRDGRVAWQHTAREEAPHEASHQDNGTWASASAMTDGQHVIASFESRGIYAYDMNGKLGWQKISRKSMRNGSGGSTPCSTQPPRRRVDHTKARTHGLARARQRAVGAP